MKKVERKFKINQIINKKGQITVLDLANDFNVAEETIRRDLKELDDEGKLQKVHGGAVSLEHNTESSLNDRFYLNTKAKEIIAKKAIQIIQPFTSIYIDFGSTTLAFAEELKAVDNLCIYTNSVLLAKTVTSANTSHKVFILGGEYIVNSHQNVGYMTLTSISNIFVDLCIIGAAAIDLENGFYNMRPDEAEIAKAMIKNSKNCILLADNSKMSKQGRYKICTFSKLNYLVGDDVNESLKEICLKYDVKYV